MERPTCYTIWNFRDARKYLGKKSTETIAHEYTTNELNYCSGLLYGLLGCQIQNLKPIQKAGR